MSMIKIPFEDILKKIEEKSKISTQEINEKIDKKMAQLSGLISKEGAAHIVANELGIKLFDEVSGKLQIKNILTGMQDVEVVGKVLRVFPARAFQVDGREGQVGSLHIGDETGTVRLTLWGEQANHLKSIAEGDIVKIKGGYVKERNNQKELHLSTRGNITINPKGESVDVQDTKSAVTRKRIQELAETDTNVEILGTVVQVFEPRFFEVCKECKRRVLQKEGSFRCDTHGAVQPDYSYVLNVFVDDGTENIRAVCFREQALQLLAISHDEMLQYRGDTPGFEGARHKLLGNITKFGGRVVKNAMFNQIELVASYKLFVIWV